MIIGCVKEIKARETRVGLIPKDVAELVQSGHRVLVESHAGAASGFSDAMYLEAGAEISHDVGFVWRASEMIVKVKEPSQSEYIYLREGLIVFAYLHLAGNLELTETMLKKGVVGVAYETITDEKGNLPLLKPMSQVAGRLAIQQAAKYLERIHGGKGILLFGLEPGLGGHVVVIGAGNVGQSACEAALHAGAKVTLFEKQTSRIATLEAQFGSGVTVLESTRENILSILPQADVIVGAVLVPGGKAPHVLLKEDLKLMERGSVLVDVSIDQGGCFESSKPTTHTDPIYIESDIVHYCVTNMPGAVPRTATQALVSQTFPYVKLLADAGIKASLTNQFLAQGMNTYAHRIVHPHVAKAHSLPCDSLMKLL